MWPNSSDLVPGGSRGDNSEYSSWNPEILQVFLSFFKIFPMKHKKINNSLWFCLGDSKIGMGIGQYLHIHVLKYELDILIFRYFLNFIYFPTKKLNISPRLCLGDSKISMGIGQYLHIQVPEYEFDILIFRYFFNFSPI